MNNKLTTEELAIFCKKKGFVFQSAEIYGGLSGFFDFGPLGVELKNNLKKLYWNKFVTKRDDVVGQDGSIITNPMVWKASGHIDGFSDLVLTTKETKTKLRADHFIEDNLKISADGISVNKINELIKKHNLKYNGENFQEVKDFNLMFETQVGASNTKNSTTYLRPETAQSIFPNFKLIAESSRLKLPFGIAQIGKAYRNEISPRDFIFRCREFEIIEMEYFLNPKTKCLDLNESHLKTKFSYLSAKEQDLNSNKIVNCSINDLLKNKVLSDYHAYWISEIYTWLLNEVGLSQENLRIREHIPTELSHYSKGTFDIEYNYPQGFKELLGIANRSSFDLEQHQKFSKQKLELFDEESKSKVLAEVIEPAMGIERCFLAVLYESYNNDKKRGNIVLNLKPKLSPYKIAIFPLMNKEELTRLAKKIHNNLLDEDIASIYDKSGSIGKRYARHDEIGTPYCITIDYETIEEGKEKRTVTIRNRNSTEQKRIKIDELTQNISNLIKEKIEFKDL